MNYRKFEADVVDLARGAGMNAAAAERLREHLDQCVGCAARFARERQMSAALKAMAEGTPPSGRSADIEAQLLAAFVERQASMSRQAQASRSVLATAAPSASAPSARPASLPAQDLGHVPTRTPVDAAPSPAAPLSAVAPPALQPRTAPFGEDEVLRFVALPTAIGLPALESGRIVRVELPTAMLPAYGLDVMADSETGVVEADLLVGQDGQARAIRFVTLDSAPRRRQ